MKIGMEVDERGDKHILLIPENDQNIFDIGRLTVKMEQWEMEYENKGQFPDPPKIKHIKIYEKQFIRYLINNFLDS